MSQSEVDNLRASIIKRRKEEIKLLEKKRDNILEQIEIEKEYLTAYEKTIPVVRMIS